MFKLDLIEHLKSEYRNLYISTDASRTLADTSGFREEIANVILIVANEIAPSLALERIERKISDIQKLDFGTLVAFLEILESTPPDKQKHTVITREYELNEVLKSAKDLLSEFLSNTDKESHERQISRLQFGTLNGDIDDLLCAYDQKEIRKLDKAVDLLKGKISTLRKDDLYLLWSQVLREFDLERHTNFAEYKDMLPDGFLEDPSADKLAGKIAEYLLQIKPQIIKKRVAERIDRYPAEIASIPLLLTLNSHSIEHPTPIEELIIRLVSKIFYYWRQFLYQDVPELSTAFSLSRDSKVATGMLIEDEIRLLGKIEVNKRFEFILNDLTKLILITQEHLSKIPTLEKALIRYKLGLEVGLPKTQELLEEYFRSYKRDDHEKEFQKKLCKYLLDQGIYSFGKKFGRDEIDLITNENPNVPYIIEAKIYKSKPTEAGIKKNISQLQTYMEKEQPGRHGILVLYNFSDRLISVENSGRWFKDRYWILPIYLGKKRASDIKESLVIKEAKGQEIIECYVNK